MWSKLQRWYFLGLARGHRGRVPKYLGEPKLCFIFFLRPYSSKKPGGYAAAYLFLVLVFGGHSHQHQVSLGCLDSEVISG